MESNRSDSRSDWEVVQLPTLLVQHSRDGETVPHKDLRGALMNREHIAPETADMVIQSAIDDGVIERQNGEGLRLLEDVNDPFEDFHHGE